MKKEDILLVVACEAESQGLLESLGLEPVYTGVGKVNATYHFLKELERRRSQGNLPRYVINAGSCGSKAFKKGSLVACRQFIQRDMDCSCDIYELGETPREKGVFSKIIEHKTIIDDLPYGICGTGDNFSTAPSKIKEVQLEDMEAYALAKVCIWEKLDFVALKYVTDGLDENGSDDWNNSVKSCAETLYEYFKKLIGK